MEAACETGYEPYQYATDAGYPPAIVEVPPGSNSSAGSGGGATTPEYPWMKEKKVSKSKSQSQGKWNGNT